MVSKIRVDEPIVDPDRHPSRRFFEVWEGLRNEVEGVALQSLSASLTPPGEDVTITRTATGYLYTFSGGGTAEVQITNGVVSSIDRAGLITNVTYGL